MPPAPRAGLILSRANLVFRRGGRTVRARNAHLPVISTKARRWMRAAGCAGRAPLNALHALPGRVPRVPSSQGPSLKLCYSE